MSELPNLSGAKELFLDVETTSFDKKRPGDSPHLGDRICGIAVTVDDHPHAWYVPIRHTHDLFNLPIEPVQKWLHDTVSSCKDWINHNILFDAHFCRYDKAEFTGRLVDTLTLSKLHNSDRLTYGLKTLCREWCGRKMSEIDKVAAYLKGIKSKNYADVPSDILGDYACEDVLGNRDLYRYIDSNCPPEVRGVWNTEVLLTPVIYDMEVFGMPVDETELLVQRALSAKKQLAMGDELARRCGIEVNPDSAKDVFDVLVNQFGLPVLRTSEKGNPSFDDATLEMYELLPQVLLDDNIKQVVELIRDYREEAHFYGLFLVPYMELRGEDGRLHPSYNQCVRTGRMSCRRPNAQQLNARAKKLIRAAQGMGILSNDYSQVEFRLIGHYIGDPGVIQAYNENPFTDFHSWVATLCGVQRTPAKTMNFMMGYGGGKAKTVSSLASNKDIVREVTEQLKDLPPEDRAAEFARRCEERGNYVYNTYHQRLPGIKSTTTKAARVCKRRGYVFNAYGRRRHLPTKASFRAFNSIVQSCAADLMKERVVAVAPRYNSETRGYGLNLFALVHDDVSMMGPIDSVMDPKCQQYVQQMLESPSVPFRVPIRTEGGWSVRNWLEASKGKPIQVDGRPVAGPVARAGQ